MPPPINIAPRIVQPNLIPVGELALQNQQPVNIGAVNEPQQQVPVADANAQNAVNNGAGPNLNNGDGQAVQFAQRHQVATGRNWDAGSDEGVLELAQASVGRIKEIVSGAATGKALLDSARASLAQFVKANAATRHESAKKAMDVFEALTLKLDELSLKRLKLCDNIKDGSDAGSGNALKGMDDVSKSLRAFRYAMQRELGVRGMAAGKMDKLEHIMRAVQDFGSSDGAVTSARFVEIDVLEHEINKLVKDFNSIIASDRDVPGVGIPGKFELKNAIADALELSHRTNDKIREQKDADRTAQHIRNLLGDVTKKTGSRKIEFSVGAGALFGLGLSEAASANVRAGVRVKVTCTVKARGDGALEATFKTYAGAEVKAKVAAGSESALAGAKAEGAIGGGGGKFTTKTYASLEDLILDTKRFNMISFDTLGGTILSGLKGIGRAICGLGTKALRAIGRHSGEMKQTNDTYLALLKGRGVIASTDSFLAKRANPRIIGERSGWIVGGSLSGGAGVELGGGNVNIGASGSGSIEREGFVKGRNYAMFSRAVREANSNALAAMLRPGPDGGEALREIPRYADANALRDRLDLLLDEAENAKPDGNAAWARFANELRTLSIAAEAACRDGRVSRDDADAILDRIANLPVRIPADIFREYLMADVGAPKPPKIRKDVQAQVKFDFLSKTTGGWTGGVTNGFGKAVVGGLVHEARHQFALDTTVKYSYSIEKPAQPGKDPRPWENVVRTTHKVTASASLPVRVLFDRIARSQIHAKEPDKSLPDHEFTKDALKDAGKGAFIAALPGLLASAAKESAKAAVLKWLQNPDNVVKLVDTAFDVAGLTLDALVKVAVWAAEHPDAAKEIASQAIAIARGTDSLSGSDRLKTLQWSFADGKLETFALYSDTTSKFGFEIEPKEIPVSGALDFTYSVDQSVKEFGTMPDPTLTTLLGKTDEFLSSNAAIGGPAGGEKLRGFLASNRAGALRLLENINAPENLEIFARALEAAGDDSNLTKELTEARRDATALAGGSGVPPLERLAALQRLLASMVAAFNSAA